MWQPFHHTSYLVTVCYPDWTDRLYARSRKIAYLSAINAAHQCETGSSVWVGISRGGKRIAEFDLNQDGYLCACSYAPDGLAHDWPPYAAIALARRARVPSSRVSDSLCALHHAMSQALPCLD